MSTIHDADLKAKLEKLAGEIDALEDTLAVKGMRATALLSGSSARLRAGARDLAWTLPNIPGFNDPLTDEGQRRVLTRAVALIEAYRNSSGPARADAPPPTAHDVEAFEQVCDAARQVIRKGAGLA